MRVNVQLSDMRAAFLVSTLILVMGAVLIHKTPAAFRAVYIHPSVDQTDEATLQRIAHFGINKVFIDIYGPTGVGMGTFLAEKKASWIGSSKEPEFAGIFSLEETAEKARRLGISVHVTVSCFGEVPAIDPTIEVHRMHLKEVVEYIATNFPLVSGIHLDYLRYIDERGLEAKGNAEPITTFVRDVRQIVKDKALSAAVLAAGSQEDYDLIRYRTGQDCREISQYLDFICPMAYHLSLNKKLEWVGSVSQFTSGIVQKRCKVFPTVQAFFQFQEDIAVSSQNSVGASLLGPTLEVPSTGMLQFDINWRSQESRFSLVIRDSVFREVSADWTKKHLSHPTGQTYVVSCNVTGIWSAELRIHSLSSNGDLVTIHVSDLNEELPGYRVLRSAISMAINQDNGFCIYALNYLSQEESQAIRDSACDIPQSSVLNGGVIARAENYARLCSSDIKVRPT